jgi:hypothetical protein
MSRVRKDLETDEVDSNINKYNIVEEIESENQNLMWYDVDWIIDGNLDENDYS